MTELREASVRDTIPGGSWWDFMVVNCNCNLL